MSSASPTTTTTTTTNINTNNMSFTFPRAKILLIGDSLTQTSFEGWGSIIANVYQRRADVINLGCSGYNTEFYMDIMKQTGGLDEDYKNVQLITIWFGANDASIKEYNPHHYVSIDNYKKNLQDIVRYVNNIYPNAKIIFITPPPVQHEQRYAYQKQRYGSNATGILERTLENAGLYAVACKDVADTLTIPCLDIYNHMILENNWSEFFSDGLHFSEKGHDYVASNILQFIQQTYPEVYVTADPITKQWNNSSSTCIGLPTWGPYHDQIIRKD